LTIGLFKGTSKAGHKGWTTVYCAICNTKIDVFKAVDEKNLYYCPTCKSKDIEAFFCTAHARNLHFKCPYCKNELKPYFI